MTDSGSQVVLRDVEASDLPIFYEHQRDPTAVEMVAFTSRERDAFDEHWAEIVADGTVTKRTVLVGGAVAGNILGFERSGKREVGYWIGREHWGKGVATAALRQFLRVATERPLHAVVATHNVGSLRVLEKCGFVVESERRGTPRARGTVIDQVVLRLDA